MDYAAFASDLPAERVIFHSAEENEETMRRLGVRQEVRQLGRGRFRCDMAVRSTMGVELFADRFNLPFAVRLEPPAGSVLLLIPRSLRGRLRVSGQAVGNDSLLYVADGSGVDIVAHSVAGSETVTIPSAKFAELAQTLCPALRPARNERSALLRGDPIALEALRAGVVRLLSSPESEPHEERLDNLLGSAVSWMAAASPRNQRERSATGTARSLIARRARDFIEANHHEAIRMEELSRISGVGIRTVQRAFREHFDLTISDYLKAVRLAAAHRDLAEADPRHDCVTAIALRRGFPHLGRFSVEFRDRFGESPSETLRREHTRPPSA
jgi:AraC-like DNA-binding protein